MTHRPDCQTRCWQSATAIRVGCLPVTVAATTKSTQAVVPAPSTSTRPMAGSSWIVSPGEPFAGKPADSSSLWTAATPDQVAAVGPPGAAHAEMTSCAVTTEPDSRARWSMAMSCPSAPSDVRWKPDPTWALPGRDGCGTGIEPASDDDRGPG